MPTQAVPRVVLTVFSLHAAVRYTCVPVLRGPGVCHRASDQVDLPGVRTHTMTATPHQMPVTSNHLVIDDPFCQLRSCHVRQTTDLCVSPFTDGQLVCDHRSDAQLPVRLTQALQCKAQLSTRQVRSLLAPAISSLTGQVGFTAAS